MISKIAVSTPVLVMLCDHACSPCYTFETDDKKQARLSAKNLRDILSWAASVQQTTREVLFLVGCDEPLNASVGAVLEDMADKIVTPLLPVDEQKSLGIPFSRNQTVVARSLMDIVNHVDQIEGRPVIVHIERQEIDKLAESLLAIQDSIGTIRLCLRDIHLLEDHELEAYERQLATIVNISFVKRAAASEGTLNLLNLRELGSAPNRVLRCPAGIGFVAIGPDGRLYPCPAFYYGGQEYSLGTISDIESSQAQFTWAREKCGICGSAQCPGCPFLESSDIVGKEQICKVYEAEKRASQELLLRVGESGYLFDCLRTLKTRECALKSQSEGGESLVANRQVHDITFDEFIRALKDLESAAEYLLDETGKDTNNDYDSFLNRWSESTGLPETSQRSIFRRRVREILNELRELRYSVPRAK